MPTAGDQLARYAVTSYNLDMSRHACFSPEPIHAPSIAQSVQCLPEGRQMSLNPSVRTGCGAHLASFSIGSGGLFQGEKGLEREARTLPPYSAKVNNNWSYTSSPPHAFMEDKEISSFPSLSKSSRLSLTSSCQVEAPAGQPSA